MDEYKPEEQSEEKIAERGAERVGFVSRVSGNIASMIRARQGGRAEAVYDTLVFLLALVFSRTSLLFGSHPLGIALVAALPQRVWMATLGAVVGALTLGGSGVLYAMVTVITVFLRVIVSGGEKKKGEEADSSLPETRPLFREGLPLRMSASLISGFVAAVYEALLSGINMTVALYGGAMVLIPPLAVVAYSGLFESGMSVRHLFFDNTAVFKERVPRAERSSRIYFQISALATLFLVGYSLGEYELLGISAPYVLAGFVTLFVARRFGPLRGAAVGFFALLGISSVGAVSYALLGIVSGTLFKMGIPYAYTGGGVALLGWSFYSTGLEGLLSVLPEYFIAALLVFPLLKRVPEAKTEDESQRTVREASDMVGTVALAYKNRYSGSVDALEGALKGISETLDKHNKKLTRPTLSELRELVGECMDRYCRTCSGYEPCINRGGSIPVEMQDGLSTILYNNGYIRAEDVVGMPDYCNMAASFAEAVNRAYAMLCEGRYLDSRRNGSVENICAIASLLAEARERDLAEKRVNEPLSEAVSRVLPELGLTDGVCKVFGQRNLHIIISAEDPDGSKITSEELHSAVEQIIGRRLSSPEYYRRGEMALLECSTRHTASCEYASAGKPGSRETISGDFAKGFTTSSGYFCALISDGMGSGEEARDASELVVDLLSRGLDSVEPGAALSGLVNGALRSGARECSATVDLFTLDLYSGECAFYKSGAALSYIKRGDSIFRITSRTAPLGLMRTPDLEKIKVDVRAGDVIVMLSDGACDLSEDAPWLLELLCRVPYHNARDYAERILAAREKAAPLDDDVTVSVLKITEKQ